MITHANQWQCTVLHVDVFRSISMIGYWGRNKFGHLFLAEESP